MRIDVWSDVVCPWCYLGHRRFTTALARVPTLEADLRFRAFELDPHALRTPQPVRAVVERKYGPGAYDAMTGRLVAYGREEGIDYRFDRAQRVNTFDAHRLLAWAGTQPAGQAALVERLFAAYFTEGLDVADHATLGRLVAETGGDADAAAAVLVSGAFADTVRADEAAALEYEIAGVPAFVLAERLVIPGAQDVDTFERFLERAQERFGDGA